MVMDVIYTIRHRCEAAMSCKRVIHSPSESKPHRNLSEFHCSFLVLSVILPWLRSHIFAITLMFSAQH